MSAVELTFTRGREWGPIDSIEWTFSHVIRRRQYEWFQLDNKALHIKGLIRLNIAENATSWNDKWRQPKVRVLLTIRTLALTLGWRQVWIVSPTKRSLLLTKLWGRNDHWQYKLTELYINNETVYNKPDIQTGRWGRQGSLSSVWCEPP